MQLPLENEYSRQQERDVISVAMKLSTEENLLHNIQMSIEYYYIYLLVVKWWWTESSISKCQIRI